MAPDRFPGHKYKVIQPHTSQPDQTPSITPALWVHIPDGEREHPGDEFKTQNEIGPGGLLIGALALGGAGFAYKDHEEDKGHAWTLKDWLQESEKRTEDFRAGRTIGLVTWVLVEGRNIPEEHAIAGGEEHGQRQYICRGWHEGSLQVGKASWTFKLGGIIGYEHKEIHLAKYEVLVGDQRALRWVNWHGRFDLGMLGARPVEGGREANGTPLYIAHAQYHHAVVPGKCSTRLNGAWIPYGNDEKECMDYQVLCYDY